MTATLQTLVVALVVAAALLYVARRAWRTLRPAAKGGCASDCGCGDATQGGSDWSR